ncbi:hypothetical protein KQ306_06085 [Synechococcus sp. CS-1324]|uniref:hypothetical protein n=1 Tax=Synechococcus sp. CS-1324 TaxID=2847980 RepID=UPI00223B4DA5|nr:hypothetical protein [Synechococcus sp. CS-1324]MCT0230422.1 hypothetical protein [Synechococcus sp. CS-1324]
MTSQIRGKVAQVLNSRELALNVGTDHGVQVGMLFDVLDPKGEDIVDPDTGDVLGSLARPKVRIKVISVQPKLAVASTYKKARINIGGVGIGSAGLAQLLSPPEYVTQYETLKTTEKTWEDISEKDSYVKRGDPVVEVKVDLD